MRWMYIDPGLTQGSSPLNGPVSVQDKGLGLGTPKARRKNDSETQCTYRV